jgi:hypothetical protein
MAQARQGSSEAATFVQPGALADHAAITTDDALAVGATLAPRYGYVEIKGTTFRNEFWTAEEWEAIPREDRDLDLAYPLIGGGFYRFRPGEPAAGELA